MRNLAKAAKQIYDLLVRAVDAIKPPYMKLIVVIAGVAYATFQLLTPQDTPSKFIPMLVFLGLLVFLAFARDFAELRYRHIEKTNQVLKDALRKLVQDEMLKAARQKLEELPEEEKKEEKSEKPVQQEQEATQKRHRHH